jgi:hypothetical protein
VRKYKYIIIQAILCLSLTGCNKYLDITPKGKTLLTTVTDYDQWLNDPVLVAGMSLTNYLADNIDDPTIPIPPATFGELIYTWAPQFSSDLSAAPQFWGTHYSNINKFNTVLIGVDNATGGTSIQIKSLKAEALLGRALEYFYLVNEYGKEYDSATAKTDLAVPFVTSNDVTQVVPPRSTIDQIYNQIITDINTAIPDLPLYNTGNRFRGSKAAAYSVLARIYFYARNYTNARTNAELALANTNAVMIDFNTTFPTTGTTSLFSVQPDVIYGRMAFITSIATLNLMRSFATNDLRLKKLYSNSDLYTFTARGATSYIPSNTTPYLQYTNTSTSVQEMKLIISESAARSNDLTTALQQLDDIRKTRLPSAGYVRYASAIQDSVFQYVLNERSRELPYSGLRWFDMRRLDKENRMDTVYRNDAQGNIIAKLPPHSSRYTLQIPVQVLSFDPGMQQNP